MKYDEIKIDSVYAVEISGKVRPVRILAPRPDGRWDARNEQMDEPVIVRSEDCEIEIGNGPVYAV